MFSNFAFRYTAVGVFVLGRLFREAWGKEAPKMQAEFNDFLEVFNGQGNASQELYDFFVCGVIDIAVVYSLD